MNGLFPLLISARRFTSLGISGSTWLVTRGYLKSSSGNLQF
ncbi:MAG: hypothetical protein O7G85_05400 [Planctomycetota bacterium]|nr:hypothetical protein [Planctomycetota bacterium]